MWQDHPFDYCGDDHLIDAAAAYKAVTTVGKAHFNTYSRYSVRRHNRWVRRATGRSL